MILSLGEQQRIAMARVLLQRPRLVFLDEATSALDESSETTLYELLIAQNPKMTVVSVGHRSSLCHLHSRRWTLEGAQFVETIEI
jgi:putative ATP-binding cassette transporter